MFYEVLRKQIFPVFLKAQIQPLHLHGVFHTDIAVVPRLIGDAGDILLILGITHDETVFGAVLRQPGKGRELIELVHQIAVIHIVVGRDHIDGKGGVVLTLPGRCDPSCSFHSSILGTVTGGNVLVDFALIKVSASLGGAVGGDNLQIMSCGSACGKEFIERFHRTGVEGEIFIDRCQLKGIILRQQIVRIDQDQIPLSIGIRLGDFRFFRLGGWG